MTSNCISPGASTRMTDRGRGIDQSTEAPSLTAAGTAMDPNNVTPAVTYLASDASANVSGRVVGTTGNKITIWREPEWEQTIWNVEPYWDIDTLFELMPQTLEFAGRGPAAAPVPISRHIAQREAGIMATHLDGRICIITGGAGGIGSNLCRVFGEQGAKVVVADTGFDVEGRFGMDASKVEAIVNEIRDAGGEAVPFRRRRGGHGHGRADGSDGDR